MNIPVLIIVVYFLFVLLLGLHSFIKIKTPADYYIASKRAHLIPVSGSLLATILGGSAILGTIELSQASGWPALWFLFCAAFGLFLLAPLAKYVSRYGKFTLPGLLGYFFGEKARLISSFIIPVAWLGIIGAQIIAAAKILAGLEIISYSYAAVLSGAVFILYTLLGGQISILKTDILQSVLIVSGLTVLVFFAVRSPYASAIPPLKISTLFNESFSKADLVILVMTYSVTFIVGPDIYSRIFCAKNEKTATLSVIMVAVLLIPVSFILTYLGVFSGSLNGEEIIAFAQQLLPDWFYGLLIAALLSAVMSSADTTLLSSSLILSELFTGNADNKKAMLLTRIFIVILGCLSIITALFITSVLQALLIGLTVFSGAFVVPMLAGLLKLKVVKKHVTIAIFAGGIIALTGKLVNIYGCSSAGNLMIIISFVISGSLLMIPVRDRN